MFRMVVSEIMPDLQFLLDGKTSPVRGVSNLCSKFSA
jgi:hypothetical protein